MWVHRSNQKLCIRSIEGQFAQCVQIGERPDLSLHWCACIAVVTILERRWSLVSVFVQLLKPEMYCTLLRKPSRNLSISWHSYPCTIKLGALLHFDCGRVRQHHWHELHIFGGTYEEHGELFINFLVSGKISLPVSIFSCYLELWRPISVFSRSVCLVSGPMELSQNVHERSTLINPLSTSHPCFLKSHQNLEFCVYQFDFQ